MNEFLLICKRFELEGWDTVSNPVYRLPHSEFFAAMILENLSVEYVEYVNSGVVYRLIRRSVSAVYGVEVEEDDADA